VVGEDAQEDLVEHAALVALSRALELVGEAELVEEGLQARVVVLAEGRVRAERIGHGGERLAEVLVQELLLGHVLGHFAHPVHVVGEREEPRRQVGHQTEGVDDHDRPLHLAERAEVGETARTIAGLEERVSLLGRAAREPLEEPARLFEGPGLALARGGGQFGIQHDGSGFAVVRGSGPRSVVSPRRPCQPTPRFDLPRNHSYPVAPPIWPHGDGFPVLRPFPRRRR